LGIIDVAEIIDADCIVAGPESRFFIYPF
jgi:hypothetical protein